MVLALDPGQVARDTAVLGRPQEPLPKPAGRVPAEGAEYQPLGPGFPGEQEVDRPELDAEGLARAGAGYDQQGAVRVGNYLSLIGVQLRVHA